jgi:hypothetical protein
LSRPSIVQRLSFGVALLAAAELTASSARACTYPWVPSYATASTVEVPTNAVLLVHGRVPEGANGLALLDAAGNAVPFDVRVVTRDAFDLIPRDELEPRQSYRFGLLEQLEMGEALEFTTGAGPAAPSAELGQPDVDAWMLDYHFASCGMVHGLCVDATLPAGTTLEVYLGDSVLIYGLRGFPDYRQILPDVGPDDCVELRLRDVRGNRSEPSVFCSDALRRFELEGDRFDVSYDCTNYESYVVGGHDVAHVPADTGAALAEPVIAVDQAARLDSAQAGSSGCSLQPAQRFTAGSLASIVAALALVVHRRRRSR